jgi:N-acetylglucosaminyldiphosphoundecaprenol N-acetyl-beta-D-mannosaminyltransferase
MKMTYNNAQHTEKVQRVGPVTVDSQASDPSIGSAGFARDSNSKNRPSAFQQPTPDAQNGISGFQVAANVTDIGNIRQSADRGGNNYTRNLRNREFSLCGIQMDAIERSDLIELLGRAKSSPEKLLVLHHNLHSLFLYETHSAFNASYELASKVYIDGLPIVWLGRAAGLPLKGSHRVTLLDSFEAVIEQASQQGWRIFYLGSTEAVLAKGLSILRESYPRLDISGRNGFFAKSGPENEEVVRQINDFKPDILFAGMGMPVQEVWLADNFSRLDVSAAISSGCTMDYVTGAAYRPPAWAGPLGLYSVFRLFHDPKRLWRRYLVEPLFLAMFLSVRRVRERLGQQTEAELAGLYGSR